MKVDYNEFINNFFDGTDSFDNPDELINHIEKFNQMYDFEQFEKEVELNEKVDYLMDKARKSKRKSTALKYAKEAYLLCPSCFESILFQAEIEDNPLKRIKILEDGLKKEKNRLFENGHSNYENSFETRAYLIGLKTKALYLLQDGRIKEAETICKELIHLSSHDLLGARYLLMAIYAYFEDINQFFAIYDEKSDSEIGALFPLFVLHYKLGNEKEAKKTLKDIIHLYPSFLKYFKGSINLDKSIVLQEGYVKGTISELIAYFDMISFLMNTIPNIKYAIEEYSK